MVGRTDEQAHLEALIDAAREGRSGALLLHGPPGIGKTELLRHAVARAEGFVLLQARGLESESGIPFAGLAELVAPLLGELDALPDVQAAAMRSALALGPATESDRFTVPAALLSLLARAADERPVLAVVDDVQWLDEPSLEAFLFAGRRLGAEGVAMLAAARNDARRVEVPWLQRMAVGPLADEDARALLDPAIAPAVADRLVATAAGNPLALLEIPALLTDAQRAGREPLADPLPPGTSVERAFAVALDALPEATRAALLLAAAASTRRLDAIGRALAAHEAADRPGAAAAPGDSPTPAVGDRSADPSGDSPAPAVADVSAARAAVSVRVFEPAEAAGIVVLARGELEFRHPLMRSAVYHGAAPGERRAAHAALAAASAGAERAWQLAACAVAPDEDVAAALEAAALEARGRGAHATAARDLQRAAQLTPGTATRARRLLAAAGDAIRSGEAEQASAWLDEAAALARADEAVDPLLAADVERLRGHVEMRRGSPVEANERLVAEADRVRGRDPRRAAAMFLEASVAHLMTGDPAALVGAAEKARALSAGTEPAVELLATAVIGQAQIALGEIEPGVAELRACEPYLMEADPLGMVEIVGMAGHAWTWVEDWDRATKTLDRVLRAAREASAVSALIHPLAAQAHLDLRRGRWASALASASEAVELAEDAGQHALLPHALAALTLVEAGLGHEADCRAHVERAGTDDPYRHAALGQLELALGRVPEAIDALEAGERQMRRRGLSSAVVQLRPDLIEAYVRAGRREEAEAQLATLEADTAEGRAARRAAAAEAAGNVRALRADSLASLPVVGVGPRWVRAAAERCRGLLAPDDAFRSVFEAALALHEDLPMPFERARTQLAFGERLRRAKQRAEAREPLTQALDEFERLGAKPWAERARSELRATGGAAAGRRAPAAAGQLTPHELQIAVLVAQGMTNREAAAALFLSPKTIEYHLGQIYRKLDVRGRSQLARLMAMELPEGERDPAVLADALS
ncbi:regulatory LuxR family protein [Solirubrobacter pauli]|uniref:Regulatory LuxR family protein n=1 Tax=Solirubrobacter pauli TaxID=166793 RepID=A0A660L2Q6_9ACTN|nr:LuxR family transcriptional regulator [Solirubrobacter pauli]RKQ87605.1 regulatory LuxR family protein [Solirubrobacter pauli]